MCDMLSSGLGSIGYDVVTTTSAEDALGKLRAADFDCMITDIRMGKADGIELCREAVGVHPTLPVIVITAFGTIRTAIEAIRAGAFDFVTKPFQLDALRHVARRAIQHGELTRRVQVLEKSLRDLQAPQRMIGTSEPIRQLQRMIERAGPSHVSVLICGESGTGKELVARMVHEASPRSAQAFLAINCAALPESLLESELFGHAKGAFTDARADKEGLFTQAGEGTLLLDEIGEMPLNLQPKLLRPALHPRQRRAADSQP
jgi:two-component system response regulator HydG